jgi:bacterioferritin-associated ferredoxin
VFVCICNAVTDREIRECAELGAATLDDLRVALGVASCCGKCESAAREILASDAASRPGPVPAST